MSEDVGQEVAKTKGDPTASGKSGMELMRELESARASRSNTPRKPEAACQQAQLQFVDVQSGEVECRVEHGVREHERKATWESMVNISDNPTGSLPTSTSPRSQSVVVQSRRVAEPQATRRRGCEGVRDNSGKSGMELMKELEAARASRSNTPRDDEVASQQAQL